MTTIISTKITSIKFLLLYAIQILNVLNSSCSKFDDLNLIKLYIYSYVYNLSSYILNSIDILIIENSKILDIIGNLIIISQY